MHRPDITPRRSLVFEYRVRPAAPVPAPGAPAVPVVVVGAGPIGLVTAIDLARRGVRCVLLTADRQVSEGSRAIVFTRRSMQILQQVGATAALAGGLPWRSGSSFYRGECVFRMEAPEDPQDRFPPMLNQPQPVIEEALVGLAEAQSGLELRWGHQVTGLRCDARGAELDVQTEGGRYVQRAHWVVACDGARSTLRQLQGLRLEGDAYEGRFVIADIRVSLPFPTERRAYFDPPWNPGNTVLMHRQPADIWRIDYQLPPGESVQTALSAQSLTQRIDAQLAMIGHAGARWELDWCSTYSARALTLPDYRCERVLYCGDAAHLLPIFGVRGANTGLQDSQNLGWKLALVARGIAPEALLGSYSHERVGAAREIIAEAGRSTRFMTPPSEGYRLLRDATLSLALSQPFVRPLFHWRTSRPHDYPDSPLNARSSDPDAWPGGPAEGALFGNRRLGEDRHLFDRNFAGFLLLLFVHDGEVPPALARILESWRGRGVPIDLLTVGRGGDLPDPDGGLAAHAAVRAPGAAYLLRPDQHVCARWPTLDPDDLDRALQRALAIDRGPR
jgi:3-(3-hydroxy-phenyl)propionate hydroxylase